MIKKSALCSLLCCLLASAALSEEFHWSYEGKDSPEHWGKIAAEFSTCQTGHNQTPIDITHYIQAKYPKKIAFHYDDGIESVINNGHTIQANFKEESGSYIELNGHQYRLLQFHFHSPSEFLIDSKQYPLEMHLVHQDADGYLLVVGIQFQAGKENKILAPIWEIMPQKDKTSSVKKIDLNKLMPNKPRFFEFGGSLTTPPCNEGVTWIMLQEPLEISKAQIEKFQKTMGGPTNRPLQPRNNRIIVQH
ncbi:hypothetical protein BKH46_07845 [Helicobacter sp. 12S02634-8]|uniref:carbonic anhydrase n=1 Tax=Helicobacter sp. 12S02634-8 TaxID=1476199 RepID=UPI000BA7A5E6|nr:carbonic anhydrase family protein [Helicobacter sp. 12S02634-8]PAF46372.1 hypothetical protein BKH46_07845 [Helicobacter sp. 12S02634-8]